MKKQEVNSRRKQADTPNSRASRVAVNRRHGNNSALRYAGLFNAHIRWLACDTVEACATDYLIVGNDLIAFQEVRFLFYKISVDSACIWKKSIFHFEH